MMINLNSYRAHLNLMVVNVTGHIVVIGTLWYMNLMKLCNMFFTAEKDMTNSLM